MTTTIDKPALDYPRSVASLPAGEQRMGHYRMRFARSTADLDAVLRLRFEIFNLELREGLDRSYRTCRDADDFDPSCHHLLVEDTKNDEIVGTYRMQTLEMAETGNGFYSRAEFDLAELASEFLPNAVELGRACVSAQHRNSRVLFLLWRGLAAYMVHNAKRFFFGCCSLTSQDPAEGKRVMEHLRRHDLIDPCWRVAPTEAFRCYPPDLSVDLDEPVKLPKLMQMYMDYGARIAGEPALDREFKTIDYLAVFDMERISPRIRRLFVPSA